MLMQKIEGDLSKVKLQPSGAGWSVSTRTMISHAALRSATKIGITAVCPGSGVSTLARELALSYASIGKAVLLVDFSSSDVAVLKPADAGYPWLPVPGLEAPFEAGDWGSERHLLPAQRAHIKAGYEELTAHCDVVVVDLPCISVGTVETPSTFLAAAAACDLVYLVCLTGKVSALDLQKGVEICRIGSVPIDGVILNDFNDLTSNLFRRRQDL